MNPSLFVEFVATWFKTIAGTISETLNGKKEEEKNLHETMLVKEYSVDLKWDSAQLDSTIVAADVVALDSELPLKRRDSFGTASGIVPKIGIKFRRGEKDITDIQIMQSRGGLTAQIVAKLFQDTVKGVKGVKEKIEAMYLQAISTGSTLVEDADNVGTAIRVSFGYKEENKHTAAIKWGSSGYKPMSDIERIKDNSDVDYTTIMLSKAAYNLLINSQEAKELAAQSVGLVVLPTSVLPTPLKSAFNAAFEAKTGMSIIVVDKNVKIEKNGVRHTIKPFDQSAVVFLTSTTVGRLVWGTLAEKSNPVSGVSYEDYDSFILLSKYSKNDPLQEFTSAQALAIPIIDNAGDISLLDTSSDNDAQTEGDANITIAAVLYTRASVITGLVAQGAAVTSANTDAELLVAYNTLTAAKKTAAKTSFVTA